MIKCKYAGDVNDECCKDCNGLVIVETNAKGEKEEIPCTECGGYEPGETVTTEKDTSNNTPPWEEETETITIRMPEPQKTAVKTPVLQDNCDTINNTNEKEKSNTVENTQEILEITAGTGISVELKGVWYKFDYSEKRAVNPNIPIQEQRVKLWEDVFNQVDNALADTKESLGI